MRSVQRRWLWILLAFFALFVFVAAASGAAVLFLRQQRLANEVWREPTSAIVPEEIEADLALYPLAGAADLETLDAAITNGDLETAYAALVYNPDLQDEQRIGRLILLGRRFTDVGIVDKADLSYQQIYEIAILSPVLSDPTRADALLAAGTGWAEVGRSARALEAYDQVYVIAVRSPYLHMAHRRDLLAMLETAYLEVEAPDRAEASRQRIIELDQGTRPQQPQEVGDSPDLRVETEVVSSAEIGAIEEGRRQAAYNLIQTLDGAEIPPGLVNELALALRAEDTAKLALYRQELETVTQLSRRIGLHLQIIGWLTLKYRVAMLGFGMSLVPEWEEQRADIQSELSKAYEDLYFDYEDLVTGLPDATLIGPGSYQVRRRMVEAGRLGLYPNYPEDQMAAKLRDAASRLIGAGYLADLYVDMEDVGAVLRFFLSPTDEYGLQE
jgi:hypothetical protein